jgi:hypothetical protein
MRTYRGRLFFFGILFLLSAGLLLASLFLLNGGGPGNTTSGLETELPVPAASLTLLLSALTVVGSAVGFAVTTFFNLRDDRRDAQRHALEMERLRQELTLKELEIERLRREAEDDA